MTWPNFLIIGAMKSGTTALYHNISQHPNVFMSPVKEPDFFSFEGKKRDWGITNREDYLALFEGSEEYPARGEASPTYMNSPQAVKRIHHYIPNVKLIAILRNPIDRAYSHYWMKVKARGGDETGGFLNTFRADDQKLAQTDMYWNSIKYRGYYYRQLKPYFETFPSKQLRVFLYDDLVANNDKLFNDIYTFLGLPSIATQEVMWTWKSGKPKSTFIYNLYRGKFIGAKLREKIKHLLPADSLLKLRLFLDKKNTAPKPKMTNEECQALSEIYKDDIIALQDLLGRDLSHWLEK